MKLILAAFYILSAVLMAPVVLLTTVLAAIEKPLRRAAGVDR